MPRAVWMSQEILQTFHLVIGEVVLIPDSGGKFTIHCNGELVFNRKDQEEFMNPVKIKQIIRDLVDPEMSLGHSDKKK